MKESSDKSEVQSTGIQESILSKLKETEELIDNINTELTDNINNMLQILSDRYREQVASINDMGDYHQTLIEKKFKTLFATLLFFGFVNSLGLIIMSVLYFIK